MPVPKKKPVAKVVVKVDQQLKALWEEATKKLSQATSAEAQDWDARYESIATILDHQPPLYLAGGFSTDADFIAKVVKEDKTSLYRNLRIARHASAEEIAKYTVSALDLAIAILESKNGAPLKGRTPIAFDKLRFSFKDTTGLVTRAFSEMTVAQLRLALAYARGHATKAKKLSPAALAIESAIKRSKAKGVTFNVSGKTVSLHLPLAELAQVARTLSGFSNPS